MKTDITPDALALQRLYHWESTAPDRVVLTQPMGGGAVRDFTWREVLDQARRGRADLEGTMACGLLESGLIARYRGPSSQAARFWFTRIWAAVRQAGGHPTPQIPRVWPFQEQPLRSST